jgi:hypothetical protein
VRGGAPWLALAVAGLFLAPSADAGPRFEALALARCACDTGELDALRARIAATEDVAQARQLAVPPLALARQALTRAQRLPGATTAFAAREQRLLAGERAIAAAATPPAVATAFSAAIGPAAAGCSYTTLEIVAIVLGFILGIIPGLILLVLLC